MERYLGFEEGCVEVVRGAGDGRQVDGLVASVGDGDSARVRSSQRRAPELEGRRVQRHRVRRGHESAPAAARPGLLDRLLAPLLQSQILH